jgi:hypothetical protein
MPLVLCAPPGGGRPLGLNVPNGCDTVCLCRFYKHQLALGKPTSDHQERVVQECWAKFGGQPGRVDGVDVYLVLALQDFEFLYPTPSGRTYRISLEGGDAFTFRDPDKPDAGNEEVSRSWSSPGSDGCYRAVPPTDARLVYAAPSHMVCAICRY